MSKVASSIRRGLEQAVECAKGRVSKRAYRAHVPVRIDVKKIRTRLGLTQQVFAARFGFSINTLRHWEQGKRVPEGPTRANLLVIARAPEAVQKGGCASPEPPLAPVPAPGPARSSSTCQGRKRTP